MEKDMTVGNPTKMILDFTVPLFIGNVSKERKGKLSLGKIGENHGTCGETGKQHGRIPRYRGNGMYEKCSSELERPYPSPNGKEKAYKLGEIVFLMEGSRRGT